MLALLAALWYRSEAVKATATLELKERDVSDAQAALKGSQDTGSKLSAQIVFLHDEIQRLEADLAKCTDPELIRQRFSELLAHAAP